MKPFLPLLAILLATGACAPRAGSPPADTGASQLERSVALRLQRYGIDVRAEDLTLQQAAALHGYMATHRGYLNTRLYAQTILNDPDFRD